MMKKSTLKLEESGASTPGLKHMNDFQLLCVPDLFLCISNMPIVTNYHSEVIVVN